MDARRDRDGGDGLGAGSAAELGGRLRREQDAAGLARDREHPQRQHAAAAVRAISGVSGGWSTYLQAG
ncbi:hypothetical protein [Amycolatopsis sp. cmx-4-61]|uniref:hypothetical protein n=1 Tax=Amycolatopsis sp. cmx-4-61 TaxID=2790937 RepID=UPI00397E5C19